MKSYASKWIMQRLTAVILIPLTFWFVYQCVLLSSYDYDQIKSFFFSKINASLFFILIIASINADIIFANAIGAEQLEISTSSGGSRIFMDGANNRIQIFDSSATNPRVVLGNLT